jgi:integrase
LPEATSRTIGSGDMFASALPTSITFLRERAERPRPPDLDMPATRRRDRHDEWWVDFRYRGRRVRERSPVQTRKDAQAHERLLIEELAAKERCGRDPFAPDAPVPQFANFIERWMRDYVTPQSRPSGQRAKKFILANHLVPAFGTATLDAITTAHVDAFIAIKAKTLAPKTVNTILSVLCCSLRTAQDWGLITTLPRFRWMRVPSQGYRYLMAEEAERLLRASQGFWAVFIRFLLRTGARFGEAAALRWDDLELDSANPVVHLRRSVNAGFVSATKTGSARDVPLPDDLVAVLRDFRHDQDLVFGRPSDGQYLSSASTQKFVHRICDRAGIRRISWHGLRHTYATELTARGVPLPAVQALLGHTTITMTARYAHVAPSTLRAYVNLLSLPTHAVTNAVGHQMVTTEDKCKIQSTKEVLSTTVSPLS